jgi:hypothetical protein
VSYVTPKTHCDPLAQTYFVSVTVCLIVPQPTTIDVAIITKIAGVPLDVQEVSLAYNNPWTDEFSYAHYLASYLSFQKISMTTLENNTSECHSIVGDPITTAVLQDKYLWWPAGTKLSNAPPNLSRTVTQVTITKNVSIKIIGISHVAIELPANGAMHILQ